MHHKSLLIYPTRLKLFLALLTTLFAGLLPAHAWRPSLYPANWTPPEESSFTTDKLIQDFSYAGYRRGEEPIPQIAGPIFNAVTAYGADPTGNRDSTPEIQSAIDAAAAAGGGVVFLPVGTYSVSRPGGNPFCLRIQNSNVVLRGAGVGRTFIQNTSFNMRSTSVIQITPSSTSLGPQISITEDLDKPTRRIPVANASAFQVGDQVRMVWAFTQGWIDEHNQGEWWSQGNAPDIARYFREITAVNTAEGWIEIDIPTRYTMKTRDNPRVQKSTGRLSGVGIEKLSIGNVQNPDDSFGENDWNVSGTAGFRSHQSRLISMNDSYDSWITNVHSFRPAGNTTTAHMLSNGILLGGCHRVTIANCQMRRSQYGGGGGNGYMFLIEQTQDSLIVDSVADFSRHGFVLSKAGASGNVFLRCEDRETKRSTGSSGSYQTDGAGSDHHQHFSHSNLFDQCHAHNSFYTAHHRVFFGGNPPHGLTSAHGVYWNTSGSGTRTDIGLDALVRSEQVRYGYIIGTSGSRSDATNPTDGNTSPADHVEGIGMGASMEPQSLYNDQLAKRMQGILIDLAEKSFSAVNTAYDLRGSIYSYRSDPVSSLWTQISGPATAVIDDASDLETTAVFPEIGIYVLELSATDGTNSASEQVVIEVTLTAPRDLAHFIRGKAQNTNLDPLGYRTASSNLIGSAGSNGRREDCNAVLSYTLPTLPVGTTLESATLRFEITNVRDQTDAASPLELHAYLLDTANPEGSGLGFFYHGPLDNSSNVKRIGTTSAPVIGNSDNNFGPGEEVRFFTLTGDALALLQSYYDGHMPTQDSVYIRFNLSQDPPLNLFQRYRISLSSEGTSLFLKTTIPPSVNAGPDQAVVLDVNAPWTPAQLATAAWYDAADPATIATNGNAVSEWRDKSGNNNHASQTNSAVRPSSGSATIGGMNAVAFRIGDGSEKQFLTAPDHPSLNLESSGGVNVFAAMNSLGYVNNGSGLNAAFSKGQLLGAQSTYGIRVGNDDAIGFQAGSNGQVNAASFTNRQILFTGTGNYVANTAQIFINGQLRDTTNPSGSFTSDNTLPLSIGRDNSAIRHANVDFGEILLVPGVLTETNRQLIEGYMAHKWGMANDLPAGHLYKNASPLNQGSLAIAKLDGSATHIVDVPLTYSWSVVSGTGDVSFNNPTSPNPIATFSSLGTYVLQLSVTDGVSTGFDEVTITVGTHFESWAGNANVTFESDASGDGVPNGLAFLLGADDPEDNALDLLPSPASGAEGLTLTFQMLNAKARGLANLSLQWSKDLGITDPWANNVASVPNASGTINGVVFLVSPGDPLNTIQATIPASFAQGGKLFGRLVGEEN